MVWQLTLKDPKGLAGQDVAERTEAIAKKVADLYGCEYEDCVDDDEYADGTKYYQWLIAQLPILFAAEFLREDGTKFRI